MNPSLAAGGAANVNSNRPPAGEDVSSAVSRMEKIGIKESVSNNNLKNNDFVSSADDKYTDPSAEFTTIIEAGHETLMKALRSRYRNIQSVSIMWSRGDIKVCAQALFCLFFIRFITFTFLSHTQSALDKAVDINDNSVIADILKEINNHP